MNKHHVVIEKPELGMYEQQTVNVKGRAFRVKTIPDTPAVIVEPAPEGGYVTVTVDASASVGTVYALIYVKKQAGRYISEPLTIDIVEPSGSVTAGLTTVNGTMNIYKDETVVISVNIIGSGKPIVSAKLVDSNNVELAGKYIVNVLGDREVEIVPGGVSDSIETDWAKVAKDYSGTFKAKLELELQGGAKCITEDYYTLKITATAPKVSATAVKLNSFYLGDKADIAFKFNGAIVEALVDEVKTTTKAPACPEWISLVNDGKTLLLDNSKLNNKKGSGKVLLKVWVEGYRWPAQISVPVSAAYTEPKAKLDVNTIILPASHAKYYTYATVNVIPQDKKVTLDMLDITGVKVATATDLVDLSAKDRHMLILSTIK